MNYIGFEDMLEQLSDKLDTDLASDPNGACQLILDEKLAIQLEPDSIDENILIASPLFELPPGKYRTEVLKSALIQNGSIEPLPETLAFIQKTSTLALFRNITTKNLTVDKLLDTLSEFVATALEWQEALDAGHTSPAKTYMTKDAKPPPFNL